jgi:hypothetical protein
VRTFLASHGISISMNLKSAPWCNGSQESILRRLRVEFGEFDRFDTYAEVPEELYQQLHYFTFERIKTNLKISPADFRQEWIARQSQLFTQILSYRQVRGSPTPSPAPAGRRNSRYYYLNNLCLRKRGIDRTVRVFRILAEVAVSLE